MNFRGSADQANPRSPATARGFARLVHVSFASSNESLQACSRDYGAAADALSVETPRLNVCENGSLAQACCVHRFFDAVGEFSSVLFFRGHLVAPFGAIRSVSASWRRPIRTASYTMELGESGLGGDFTQSPSFQSGAIRRSICRWSRCFFVRGLGGSSATIDAAAEPMLSSGLCSRIAFALALISS